MSLRLKLTLTFAAVFGVGFGALGLLAVRVTGAAVEREAEERIEATLDAISRHARFFITEVEYNHEALVQVAAFSGFEIVVLRGDGEGLRGSSLEPGEAVRILEETGDAERLVVTLEGERYLAIRAESAGRPFYLLSPLGAGERVMEDIRESILVISVFGLAGAIVLAVLVSGSVTRPLRRLARRAEEVREGRLDVEIPRGGGRETEALAASFREMLAGLSRYRSALVQKEKMATLGQFSASVAHELRNPLSSMRMTVQLLRDGGSPERRVELDVLLAEIARLDHSIEELLFHAGEPRHDRRPIDLRDVVRGAVEMVRPLADHLEVGLSEEVPETRVAGVVDGGKVRQALTNLLLNAIQICEADGRVSVRLERAGDEVVFAVSDTGPGVAPEIAGSLWEPFVSGREGGTGLGLSVARTIAKAYEGGVEYERRGDRTVFSLRLRTGE